MAILKAPLIALAGFFLLATLAFSPKHPVPAQLGQISASVPSGQLPTNNHPQSPSPESIPPQTLTTDNFPLTTAPAPTRSQLLSAIEAYFQHGLPAHLLSQLTGPKGDKGDAGLPAEALAKAGIQGPSGFSIGSVYPTATNQSAGTIGGITFFGAKDLTSQTLTVSGASTLSSLTVSGGASVGGSLTAGTTTLGDTTLASLTVSGSSVWSAASISSNLELTSGYASLSNTLWVSPPGYAGNVGIGTTSPGAKLDVNGTLNVSGAGTSVFTVGTYGNSLGNDPGVIIYNNLGVGRSWHTNSNANNVVLYIGDHGNQWNWDIRASSGNLYSFASEAVMSATGGNNDSHTNTWIQALSTDDGLSRTVTNQVGLIIANNNKHSTVTVQNAIGLQLSAQSIGTVTNISFLNYGNSQQEGNAQFDTTMRVLGASSFGRSATTNNYRILKIGGGSSSDYDLISPGGTVYGAVIGPSFRMTANGAAHIAMQTTAITATDATAVWTIDEQYGLLVGTGLKQTGTANNPIITTAYGLYVQAATVGSANNYGIVVDAPSGGSISNFGIKNSGALLQVGNATFTGNIGIGTTTPKSKFTLVDTTAESGGASASFTIRANSVTTGALASLSATSLAGGSVFSITVPASSSNNNPHGILLVQTTAGIPIASWSMGGTLSLRGRILSHGANSSCTGINAGGSGCIDYAESFPTADPTLSAGEIVAVDPSNPSHVIRADYKLSATSSLLGIVSTNPAALIDNNAFKTGANAQASVGTVPIALAGRVPVRISTENGPILPGDSLSLSPTIRGTAVKAITVGTTIGIALEPSDNCQPTTDNCSILVFVNRSHFDSDFLASLEFIASDSSHLAPSTSPLARLVRNILAYISDTFGFIVEKGKIQSDKLCAGTTCVDEQQLQQILQTTNNQQHTNATPPPIEPVIASDSAASSTATPSPTEEPPMPTAVSPDPTATP